MDIFIDMDGTLMDFANGDLDSALASMNPLMSSVLVLRHAQCSLYSAFVQVKIWVFAA